MPPKTKGSQPSPKAFNGAADANPTLQDVMTAIAGSKTDLKGSIQELTKSVEFLSNRFDEVEVDLKQMKSDNLKKQKRIDELEVKTDYLYNTLEKCRNDLEDQIQYSRNRNIVIYGVEFQLNEDVHNIVSSIAKKLNLPEDFDVMHRNSSKKGIIVQFRHRQARDEWIAKRVTKLSCKDVLRDGSNTKIFINEHLSPYYQDLLKQAKAFAEQFKFQFCWFRYGKVLLRRNDDVRSKVISIRHHEDLNKLQHELSETKVL